MKSVNEIFESLKDIISKELSSKKVYDKDLAKFLEINQATLATMKKRGKIPYDKVLDFCAKRKISINWLLYNQTVDSTKEETEKYAKIRYFSDIYASAGGGAFNYDENSEYINLDKQIADKLKISSQEAKNIDAINVTGDSMEPTLHDGDMVFVDKNQKEIKKGGIFVLLREETLFIKRVMYQMDGKCNIISDNPSYPSETIPCESLQIVGKVIGSLCLKP
ncbi:MAG: LexA family transcriptional regulator [Epsilonproteobacteria bacterium]|nr:LexA family transcriptional regulator [Campylobacterota bacterium]